MKILAIIIGKRRSSQKTNRSHNLCQWLLLLAQDKILPFVPSRLLRVKMVLMYYLIGMGGEVIATPQTIRSRPSDSGLIMTTKCNENSAHDRIGLKRRSKLWLVPILTLACAACSGDVIERAGAQTVTAEADDGIVKILPGDGRFNTPDFEDFEAIYNSKSSKTGSFTLQARTSGSGKKLSLIEIIPMKDSVIVAQTQVDLATQRVEFSSGPYFAWGKEFVVGQSTPKAYSWTRVPIGGGEPKVASGEIQNSGYAREMFSPTLASLMPMEPGSKFKVPEAYPRKGENVTSELDTYEVLRREQLTLSSGLSCNCWVIEKSAWGGLTEEIWVDRKAPFVFRRIRDKGGKREFTSDLLGYRQIDGN